MDKKAKRIDRAQNLAIMVLLFSFLFLLVQTPLFGDGTGKSLSSTVRGWLRSDTLPDEAEDVSLSTLSVPVRVVQSNGFVRIGSDALTTTDTAFENAAAFLGEAVGSSYGISSASESILLSALEGAGLYFEFSAEVPLEVLSARLGVSAPSMRAFNVHRCLLSAAEGNSVALYLQDADGTVLRFSTAVRTSSLMEYLETLDGKSVEFACLLGEDYAFLSPYTLVFSEIGTRRELNAANALTDYPTDELLRCAGFNPHTKDWYRESTGTIVVLEAQRTLYIHTDGTVEYSGTGSADANSLYAIPTVEGSTPTRTEICSAARTLISSLVRGRIGDAVLFLSGMEGDSEEGYTMFFDYMVNGTPLRFSDGSHAAELSVRGRSITSFRLRLRRYTLSDRDSLLLPLALSRAIAQNMPGCELSIAYVDPYSDTVSTSWIAD